jgi:ATP-dependent DNA helicase DinG
MAMRVRDLLGSLRVTVPGYEERPAQLEMAEAVERALREDRHLFVEAGTGTGKTLAYLLPALLSGRKVIVSTATKALQEQVFAKDIPLVAQVLGRSPRVALMKGLSNYLCKRRYEETRLSGLIDARLERWAKVTDTGDRAELSDLPEDAEAWRDVHSSSETRIGQECQHYDECFVTRMKKDAEQAELVVVNHHLFLADLALRSGPRGEYASAIPNYDAVVFDEAHQLEDIATDFFGARVSTARVEGLLRDAERTFLAEGKMPLMKSGGARSILDLAREASDSFFLLLAMTTEGRRTLVPDDWTHERLEAYERLDAAVHALQTFCDAEKAESILLVGKRARDLRRDLNDIVLGSRKGRDPDGEVDRDARVAWIDQRRRSVSLGASPIDLGPTLRERLFDRVKSVICTSATLATTHGSLASFHFAKARLGGPPDAGELVLPSPFDFAQKAALYVARDLPEPADPMFEGQAAERIVDLIKLTGGGAFVLCTSTRAMNALHRRLRGRTSGPVLVQGEAPKNLLLSKFRSHGHAVLVATMSFWEGVDVPGHALRLVILDKIPFAVPTDPVTMARCEQIDRNGGSSFAQYSVPTAAITLKQGFGRLIRTQKDAGIVALLDRRAVTKSYGRSLLASLPPARRIDKMEALEAFWKELHPPAQPSLFS